MTARRGTGAKVRVTGEQQQGAEVAALLKRRCEGPALTEREAAILSILDFNGSTLFGEADKLWPYVSALVDLRLVTRSDLYRHRITRRGAHALAAHRLSKSIRYSTTIDTATGGS